MLTSSIRFSTISVVANTNYISRWLCIVIKGFYSSLVYFWHGKQGMSKSLSSMTPNISVKYFKYLILSLSSAILI